MSVEQELRLKRAELAERIEELSRLQAELQGQVLSIDAVITIYEPNYVPAGSAGVRRRPSPKKSDPFRDEVKALLNGVSQTHYVLETLRDAPEPLTASGCATRIAGRLGLQAEDPKIPYITSRVAATLGNLAKIGRVRQVGMADSRRHLWEIAV